MVKSDPTKYYDFDKIVTETYEVVLPQKMLLPNVEAKIKVLELVLMANGCYLLSYGKKSLEIPKNWSFFNSLEEGQLINLNQLDKDFLEILKNYFGIEGDVYLARNGAGPYFFIKQAQIKKAA